jgi:hypothetical protein
MMKFLPVSGLWNGDFDFGYRTTAIHFCRRTGANCETVLVRENLAEWTSRSGDAAGACARYTELLAIQRRVLGSRPHEHP